MHSALLGPGPAPDREQRTSWSSLPEPGFNTNYTFDIVQYRTTRSQSIPTILPSHLPGYGLSSRRLSRKLPPNLTESLEQLTLSGSPPMPADAKAFADAMKTQKMYTLEVAAPLAQQSSETIIMPLKSIAAVASPAAVPRRTSIPRKSVPRLMTPPRSGSSTSLAISAPMAASSSASSMTDARPLSPVRPASRARYSVASITTDGDSLPPLTPKHSIPSLRSPSRQFHFGGSSSNLRDTPSPSASTPTLTPSRAGPPASASTLTRKGAGALRSPSLRSLLSRPSAMFAEPEIPGLSCSSGSESTCGSPSTFDVEYHPSGKRREGRKDRKARKAAEKARFDESIPPTTKELYEASLMDVIDERGDKVRFGDLVRGKRTIVVFIRHWFCSMCAQYIKSIIREVSPDALDDANVDLIIIGNGSAKMIDGYANKHFNSPFKTYTDPTLALYRILGLTRQSGSGGSDEDKGDYVIESVMEQTVNTLQRATKMPLRNPGHFTQLGGEFVFDGTLNVTYTHRMLTTRDHAPIRDVCAEAGVRLEFIHYEPGPPPPAVHLRSRLNLTLGPTSPGLDDVEEEVVVIDAERRGSTATVMSTAESEHLDELDLWQAEKDKTLDRIKALRQERRGRRSSDGQAPLYAGDIKVVNNEEETYGEFGQFPPSRYVY